ncbi:glycosyltransferase family 4 protein [Aurantivibrio infirmus]
MKNIKVAFVHEWLVTYAGAERVLEQMLNCLPSADLYCVIDFLSDKDRSFLGGREVTTSFIQKIPFAKKRYKNYLPLMPLAVEQFDLSNYDIIISSSHAVAKGVITGPDQLHICMCYSPMRYAWDLQHQYLRETGLDKGVIGFFAKRLLHKLRVWDLRTANGVDTFVAISHYIKRRIYKVYRRDSIIIYPPVDLDNFEYSEDKSDVYVTASRLVPYKRLDLIVEAFAKMPTKRLVVIGDGPEMDKIRNIATENVTLMGYQENAVLVSNLRKAKAFLFAAEEDFGIAPVEAQACGTPVIAFDKGGASETVVGLDQKNPTGVFFAEQSSDAICDAVNKFESQESLIYASNCRSNAEKFSIDRFRDEFSVLIENEWAHFVENSKLC